MIIRNFIAPCALGLVLAMLVPAMASAEDIGNVGSGRDYARAHCAECHAVGSGDDVPVNPDAPDFVSVANTPGITARALAVWLETSHPTMPNFIIPAESKDDLIAYIMSLKTR